MDLENRHNLLQSLLIIVGVVGIILSVALPIYFYNVSVETNPDVQKTRRYQTCAANLVYGRVTPQDCERVMK